MLSYPDFIDEANLQRPTVTFPETGSTLTVSYGSPNSPPARSTPSHIVHDAQLLQKMRRSVKSYLVTKIGERPVSDQLTSRLWVTRESLAQGPPNLTCETTARDFFMGDLAPLVTDLLYAVDGLKGVQMKSAATSYGANPDSIWGDRVHVEFKSPRALLRYSPTISDLGKANGGKGSVLVLRPHEEDGRYIIFKIGISMAMRELTWGILTSGLVSIFFHRHVAHDTNGEPHHVLSCSDPIYSDAKYPSLFSLCATTLLGNPETLVVRPLSSRGALQPYLIPLPLAAIPSSVIHSKACRHRGGCNYRTLAAHHSSMPRGSTARDAIFPPHMLHTRRLLYPVRTLLGVRKVTTFNYQVGVCGQWAFLTCPTLHVQFIGSYWPDAVYKVCRICSGDSTSPFSGHGTTCHFLPPHLKLYEMLGQGEYGQVLNGVISKPECRIKHKVVAKLFLSAHLDRLRNEICLYQTQLVGLHNKVVPKVFGAFVVQGSSTMEKWGIIVMEKCGSTAQSVNELTVDQREAAYRSLWHIHQAGVAHCDFHLNNILFSSGGVRIVDFSEAVEHNCPGPDDCHELLGARRRLELPPLVR